MAIIKYIHVIIGVIIATLVLPTIHVSASEEKPEQTQIYVDDEEERESGFYREDGYPRDDTKGILTTNNSE